MKNLINKLYIHGLMAKQNLKKLWKEERGDTNIIAIILILAVVIALVVLFRNQIGQLFDSIMSSITKDVGDVIN